jgi:hypothetical protein
MTTLNAQEALAIMQAEMDKQLPEPVAVIGKGYYLLWTGKGHLTPGLKVGDKLYAEPPAREPLTDEQIHDLWDIANGNLHKFTRAIEAAHDIKGRE